MQENPGARQFRRQLSAEPVTQLLRALNAFADEQAVAALIERRQ
jgi:hypothetical protein